MTTHDLSTEVSEFRTWQLEHSGLDPEEHYPAFGELRSAAISAASQPAIPRHALETILEVLGLDNEAEHVLDTLSELPASGCAIALAGLSHPDWNARWQIAVLLGRLATPPAIDALRHLLRDTHEYVRRRALLAIRDHDRATAEQTSILWLRSKHEYSRMVALDTLDFLDSPHVGEALEALRDDPSDVVLARHFKIASRH